MKIKNSQNKKLTELLNYPKRICNNPNPNPAGLEFYSVLNYFTARSLQCISCTFLMPI